MKRIVMFFCVFLMFGSIAHARLADHKVNSVIDAGIDGRATREGIQIEFKVRNISFKTIEKYRMVIGIYFLDGTKETVEVTGPDNNQLLPKKIETGVVIQKIEKEIKFIRIDELGFEIQEKEKRNLKDILIPKYVRDIKFTPITISIIVMVLLALLAGFSG